MEHEHENRLREDVRRACEQSHKKYRGQFVRVCYFLPFGPLLMSHGWSVERESRMYLVRVGADKREIGRFSTAGEVYAAVAEHADSLLVDA